MTAKQIILRRVNAAGTGFEDVGLDASANPNKMLGTDANGNLQLSAPPSGNGDMLSINNLSDLANIALARQNLGIPFTKKLSKSSNFSIQTSEFGVHYSVAAGTSGVVCTVLDPATAGDGFIACIYKSDSSVGNVTFAGTGASNRILYFQNDCIIIRSNGVTWDVLSFYSKVTHDDDLFGDMSDNATTTTISGALNITKDMNYNNLTLAAGCAITFASAYRINVAGVLDIQNAPANAISIVPSTAASASGTNQGTGGGAGNSPLSGTMGGASAVPGAGANGAVGAGAQATNSAGTAADTCVSAYPSVAQSGAGGSGSGGAGGAVRATTTSTITTGFPREVRKDFFRMSTASPGVIRPYYGGCCGQSGSSGGGDGTNVGGGGGCAGKGGGIISIWARKIIRGVSTAVNAIVANGGKGGNGGSPATGNCGGGGAGAGGSGGGIYLCFGELLGSVATNCLQAKGGDGGNGGTGIGTGNSGTGGYAGPGGRVMLVNLSARTFTETTGGNVVANTTITGGIALEFQASL